MRIDPAKLRMLSVVIWILVLPVLFYNLHQKYQSIEACHSQSVQLDAQEAKLAGIEATLSGAKK